MKTLFDCTELEKEIEEGRRKLMLKEIKPFSNEFNEIMSKEIELKERQRLRKEVEEIIDEYRNIAQYKHPDGEFIIQICNDLKTRLFGEGK